ncbi:helix-turn-helix transcriptional regulator [Actinoplanes sp. NPDC089786]|uniref:helix-turn-helix domain-containing protein n=1 Tax=Actinoplanes sp. NPDC089786 TaxID=3155185 RepID=UPI003446102C
MKSQSSSAQQALAALGTRLREIRIDAGLTGRALAKHAGWHESKVSKIEYGRIQPSPEDIRAWCLHTGVSGQAAELVASLRAVEGMFVEWRRMESTGLRRAQEAVIPLWAQTRNFHIYNPRLIPGPIQTRGYIAALLNGLRLRRSLIDDVEDAVQVRVDKQRVVVEGSHRFSILLEESVLRYQIGGTEVMTGQLGHLLAVSSLPSVSLGIIPLGADRSRTWSVEGFWMFDEKQVKVELVSGHLTITQPHELKLYKNIFRDLSDLAVFGREARTLIAGAIDHLDGTRG